MPTRALSSLLGRTAVRGALVHNFLRRQGTGRQRLEDVQLGRDHDRARRHDPKPTLQDSGRRNTEPESEAFRQVFGNDAEFHRFPSQAAARRSVARRYKAI